MTQDHEPPNDALIGKCLGDYQVEALIGSGATGSVYRAHRTSDHAVKAIKVLHESMGHVDSLRRRFEREARALARLEHDHIVGIDDFGVEDGITFIAMELLEGQTLEDCLRREPIPPGQVLPIAMPGIVTGTLLGLARAMGETAPLLMIGMVAFIVDVPTGFTDAASALPVQIFLWADSPERGFVEKVSGAILVLLALLGILNGAAIMLRQRFEQRW